MLTPYISADTLPGVCYTVSAGVRGNSNMKCTRPGPASLQDWSLAAYKFINSLINDELKKFSVDYCDTLVVKLQVIINDTEYC